MPPEQSVQGGKSHPHLWNVPIRWDALKFLYSPDATSLSCIGYTGLMSGHISFWKRPGWGRPHLIWDLPCFQPGPCGQWQQVFPNYFSPSRQSERAKSPCTPRLLYLWSWMVHTLCFILQQEKRDMFIRLQSKQIAGLGKWRTGHCSVLLDENECDASQLMWFILCGCKRLTDWLRW